MVPAPMTATRLYFSIMTSDHFEVENRGEYTEKGCALQSLDAGLRWWCELPFHTAPCRHSCQDRHEVGKQHPVMEVSLRRRPARSACAAVVWHGQKAGQLWPKTRVSTWAQGRVGLDLTGSGFSSALQALAEFLAGRVQTVLAGAGAGAAGAWSWHGV
jgi:hypothetical protein